MKKKTSQFPIFVSFFACWLFLAAAPGCGNAPLESTAPLAEQNPMKGKADGIFGNEQRPPDLHDAYWLTGSSRLLVEGAEDGEREEVVSHFSALVFVAQDRADLGLTIQTCDIALPKVADRELDFDEGAIHALRSGLVEGGLVWSQENLRWELWTADAVMVLGANLEDPDNDPLPTDKHDPALYDVDRDGEPGISIRSGMFKVYGAFKFRLALLASMTTEGAFAGESVLEVDQQLYGDNIPFFDAVDAAREALDAWVVLEADHFFNMAPIPLNEARCAGRDIADLDTNQ